MATYIKTLIQQYEEAVPHADPRTKNWFLLNNNPFPVWILTALYITVVFVGPRIMKNRQPFNLQMFMIVYNLALVGLSIYMFIELFLGIWGADYNLWCASYSTDKSPKDPRENRVARVLWWYFFSKAVELMDTVLMILRKKFEQVTFLHWFHHASMLNIWWWTMMFIPGGMSWFGAWLNCLVHVVMYSYYGLSVIPSLKQKLWFKKYITTFQLVQFVITFVHTFNSLRVGCDFPHWGQNLLAGYMLIMLTLFSNFYLQTYIKKKKRLHHKSHSNGGIADYEKKAVINGDKNGFIHNKAD
ncbi:elongation of very long chain fatty acids protein 5-like isoform X2 [Gigantopelta aegis]|nr:elongation of very long chain fatty acids protein 5-like isoform X2 [Gigantopelta aegis]